MRKLLALFAGVLLLAMPLSTSAAGGPVLYGQLEFMQVTGSCGDPNLAMVGVGSAGAQGDFTINGQAQSWMTKSGPFPNQFTGNTFVYDNAGSFIQLAFTGVLRCDESAFAGAEYGYMTGPVWAACMYDANTGQYYRANGSGRDNGVEFYWVEGGGFGVNFAMLSGRSRAVNTNCGLG